MKDAIAQFRIQLGAAIDSVEFVKRALGEKCPKMTAPRALRDTLVMPLGE